MKKEYWKTVLKALESIKGQQSEVFTEADIQYLAGAVQKYLRPAGVVGKEKMQSPQYFFNYF